MIEELEQNHTPKYFVGRESEFFQLDSLISNFLEKNEKRNVLINGNTAQGKTLTLEKIREKYPDKIIYVSCAESLTPKKIFRKLYSGDFSSIMKHFQDKFQKEGKKIFIFDEVNKIDNSNLEEFFNCLNTMFRILQVPIIVITNRGTIERNIPADAWSTLRFNQIIFHPYNQNQIISILESRIREAKENSRDIIDIPEDSLFYLSMMVVKNDSDVRLAMSILNDCINYSDFSEVKINELIDNSVKQETKFWFNSLNETEKIFLDGLINIIYKKKVNSVSFSEICSYIFEKSQIKTSGRVSQLIHKFKFNIPLLKTEYLFLGVGGGKEVKISFISDKEIENLIFLFERSYDRNLQ